MEVVADDEIIVKKADLVRWHEKISDAEIFRADAEREIGEIITKLFEVVTMFQDSPTKLIMKLTMGKGDSMAAELGLDLDAYMKVLEKFAPIAMERLKQSQKK